MIIKLSLFKKDLEFIYNYIIIISYSKLISSFLINELIHSKFLKKSRISRINSNFLTLCVYIRLYL